MKSCWVSDEPPRTLLRIGLLSFEQNFDDEAMIRWTDVQEFDIN